MKEKKGREICLYPAKKTSRSDVRQKFAQGSAYVRFPSDI